MQSTLRTLVYVCDGAIAACTLVKNTGGCFLFCAAVFLSSVFIKFDT